MFCLTPTDFSAQAIATLGAVPHLVRLLKSKNEVIAEGASEALLHIVTPSEGSPQSHPSQTALRAAGAIPSLLGVVRFCVHAHLAGVASLARRLKSVVSL